MQAAGRVDLSSGDECLDRRIAEIGCGALSGALLVLATSPLGLGLLAFPALAPVFLAAIRAERLATAVLSGLACGLVFFGAGFLWVPLNLAGQTWLVWAIGVPLLALPVAGVIGLVAALRRSFGPAPALCLAPALWVALEALRALGPLGIGWLRLGHALAPWPVLIQLAATGGVGLVSAWAAAVGALIAYAIATSRRGAWALPIALIAIGTLAGVGSLARAEIRGEPRFRVAAVQPSVPAGERFVPAHFDANLARLIDASQRALADAPADLMVWPESAFEKPAGPSGVPFLGAIASTLETPLLAGVRRLATPDATWRWNSAVLAQVDGDTRILADKQRPLPLYERAPDGWLAGILARVASVPGRVLAGAPAQPQLVTAKDGSGRRIGVLICIDSVYPEIARQLRQSGADLLVSIANEAEAGSWSARQHALLIRLRAVETGLPLVRVANGGPGVWIDPLGREIARIDRSAGVRTASLGPALDAPLYVSLGDAPVLAALFLPGLLSAFGVGLDARVRLRGPEGRIVS
jgi:apolipoprotein N-acyltransferase